MLETGTTKIILIALGVVVSVGVFGSVKAPDQTTPILGFCGMICVTLLGLLRQEKIVGQQEKLSAQADDAAKKVAKVAVKAEEVKQTLEAATSATTEQLATLQASANVAAVKAEESAVTANKTHTLVNSNMGVQLELNAVVTRRLADITQTPADANAATMAESLLHNHVGKQADVDVTELTRNLKQ